MSVTVCRRLQQHFTEILVIPKWHSNCDWSKKALQHTNECVGTLTLVVGSCRRGLIHLLLDVFILFASRRPVDRFPQPPKSKISEICNSWGFWLAAMVKGVHWVWFTCLQMYLFHVRPGRSYKIPTAPEELNLGNLQLLGLWLARCVATQTCKALRSRKRGKSKHGGAKMSPDRSQKRIQTPHSQTKPKENFLKSASGHHPLRGLWLSTRSPSKPHNPKFW